MEPVLWPEAIYKACAAEIPIVQLMRPVSFLFSLLPSNRSRGAQSGVAMPAPEGGKTHVEHPHVMAEVKRQTRRIEKHEVTY